MKRLDGFLRTRFASLVLLAAAAGFAMILVELLMTRHTRGVQLVGVASAVLGGVLTLAGLLPWRAVRYGAAGLLLVVAASGVLGVYYHNGGERESRFGSAPVPPAIADATTVQERFTPPNGGFNGGNGSFPRFERRRNDAPLAPLALSGLAGLAMLAMIVRRPGARRAPGADA